MNPIKSIKAFISIFLENKKIIFWVYNQKERAAAIRLINSIKKERPFLLKAGEAHQLYTLVKSVSKIPGDFVEVGTYQGASAKLVCEAKGARAFHVFDTFEGLPKLGPNDKGEALEKGLFSSNLKNVQDYLKSYPNVFIVKGIFPDSASSILNKKFAFVHLDVDLYQGILDSLKFFYLRMSRGGVILMHDYIYVHGHTYGEGIREAVQEFFHDKPEPVIELSGNQCLIVKL